MKNTPLLQSVKNIFESVSKPVTVLEIQNILDAEGLEPNKTTLYRMLEKLKEEGFIEGLILDNKTTYYELKTHHHHHFRCEDCDEIRCINDSQLETQIHSVEAGLRSEGVVVNHHHFFLTGKCTTCV